ncbi:MAG: alpha/beta fold hydrolase [Aquihabitans sp.]
MSLRRSAGVLVVGALFLAGCGGSDGEPSSTTSTAASSTDETNGSKTTTTAGAAEAPIPEEPGPYAVGRRTEKVVDPERSDRTLTVEVWYPTDDAGDPTPYELIAGVGFDSDLSTQDADPSAEGPFPLVVFSHGSGGLRQQSASIVETVASHGFVVVAPDHAGNTAIDQLVGTSTDPEVTARNRVLDTRFMIDEVEAGDLAAGLADIDQVAVMGHSFGGFTALAMAGGFDGIEADPRVDVIVPLAPASSRLDDDALASINIPMLIVTGTNDETTPIDDQSTRPLELAGGPATLVEIEGATHSGVTNICDIVDAVGAPDANLPDGALEAAQSQAGTMCDADAPIQAQEAFDITEHYVVSFLRLYLYDDARYADVAEIDGAVVRP